MRWLSYKHLMSLYVPYVHAKVCILISENARFFSKISIIVSYFWKLYMIFYFAFFLKTHGVETGLRYNAASLKIFRDQVLHFKQGGLWDPTTEGANVILVNFKGSIDL